MLAERKNKEKKKKGFFFFGGGKTTSASRKRGMLGGSTFFPTKGNYLLGKKGPPTGWGQGGLRGKI